MKSSPLDERKLVDYADDSKRRKSVYDDKISPPIQEISLYYHCPALAAFNSLMKRNFFVMDDFVAADEVKELRAEVQKYKMVEGEIGTSSSSGKGEVKKEVRDDVICWFEGSEPFVGKVMKRHILRCDVFSQKIQILLDSVASSSPNGGGRRDIPTWEGAGRTKIMASLYRASNARRAGSAEDGAKYNPHFDNPNKNGRRLTVILYLNPQWKPQDGGRLRVKTQTEVADIAPLGGRLVCFFADGDRVPHEVLPAKAADRYAITIWYLDKNERREAEARDAALKAEQEAQ